METIGLRNAKDAVLCMARKTKGVLEVFNTASTNGLPVKILQYKTLNGNAVSDVFINKGADGLQFLKRVVVVNPTKQANPTTKTLVNLTKLYPTHMMKV